MKSIIVLTLSTAFKDVEKVMQKLGKATSKVFLLFGKKESLETVKYPSISFLQIYKYITVKVHFSFTHIQSFLF